MVESMCRITRADFLHIFGRLSKKHRNRHTPVGNLHFVVVPKGLIKHDEVPTFWGILEMNGNGLTEIKKPIYGEISENVRMRIAENLLWIKTNCWNSRYGHQLINFMPEQKYVKKNTDNNIIRQELF